MTTTPSPAAFDRWSTKLFHLAAMLALAVCLALCSAGSAMAAPVDLSTIDANASKPRVAVNDSGDAVAIWRKHAGNNLYFVQAATRPAGGSWGAASNLTDPSTTVSADWPRVSLDAAGNATAVWRREDGSVNEIQSSARPAGGSWSAPVTLSAVGGDADFPNLSVNTAGVAVAVWEQDSGGTTIVQASVRPAGGSWGAAVDLTAADSDADAQQVDVDAAGNAIAIWTKFVGGRLSRKIVQSAVRPAGGSWGTPVNVSATGVSASTPRLAVSRAGDATVVWLSNDGTNVSVKSATRPAGGTWTAAADLSAAGGNPAEPRVAIDGAGNSIAAWNRSNGTNTIVQSAGRPAGGAWSSPVDLSAAGANADDPEVATDQSGNATVVWRRSDGNNLVVQSAIRPPGGSWSTPIDLSATGGDADFTFVGVDERGNATATWYRNNGTYNIVQSTDYRVDNTAPAPPSGLGTSPPSPAEDASPEVYGSAEAGSTVRVYANASCSGTPVATGTAAAFASPGLTVTVAAGSTTTFSATATDAAANASACSPGTVTYTNNQSTSTTPEDTTTNPGTSPAPQIIGLKATRRCARRVTITRPTQGIRGIAFTYALSEPATVSYLLERQVGSRGFPVCPKPRPGPPTAFARITSAKFQQGAGRHNLTIATVSRRAVAAPAQVTRKRLRPGLYRVSLVATNAEGRSSAAAYAVFRVLTPRRSGRR